MLRKTSIIVMVGVAGVAQGIRVHETLEERKARLDAMLEPLQERVRQAQMHKDSFSSTTQQRFRDLQKQCVMNPSLKPYYASDLKEAEKTYGKLKQAEKAYEKAVQDEDEAIRTVFSEVFGGLNKGLQKASEIVEEVNDAAPFFDGTVRISPKQAQLEADAREGDVDAAFELGRIFENEGKCDQALEFYQIAIDQNHAPALFNVARMYEVGSGVTQDYGLAANYYQLAADQNCPKSSPKAQSNLGTMYARGHIGLTKDGARDLAKAHELFQAAAQQGHKEAMKNLGWMCERGDGCEQNLFDAAAWYKQAGEAGNSKGYLFLGNLFTRDCPTLNWPMNLEEAASFYRKAGQAGNASGYLSLGQLYTKDCAELNWEKDLDQARSYMERALKKAKNNRTLSDEIKQALDALDEQRMQETDRQELDEQRLMEENPALYAKHFEAQLGFSGGIM